MRPFRYGSLSLNILIAVAFITAIIGYQNREFLLKTFQMPDLPVVRDAPANYTLPEQRLLHILHGDETGGGHLHGAGVPCKSEFPESWNAERIANTALEMANDHDDEGWRIEPNGYAVDEDMIDELEVRVVVDPKASEVVTTYPINVERNACP